MNQLAEIEIMLSRPGDWSERYAAMDKAHAAARKLWVRWCALNDVTMRRQAFAFTHLAAAKYPSWKNQSWRFETWPGNDHTRWFWHAHRPAMIVSEPYYARELSAMRARVERLGLELHHPPNPYASFHYPGRTVFAVIARPGRGVRWLDEQRVYEARHVWG